jgi:hypothetical protein
VTPRRRPRRTTRPDLAAELADAYTALDLLGQAHFDACALILDRLGPDVLAEYLGVEVHQP